MRSHPNPSLISPSPHSLHPLELTSHVGTIQTRLPPLVPLHTHIRHPTTADHPTTRPLHSSSRPPAVAACALTAMSLSPRSRPAVLQQSDHCTPPHHVPIRRDHHQRDCLFQRPSQTMPHKRRRFSPSAFLSSAFTGPCRFCWQHKDTRQLSFNSGKINN
ncbi:hypothetical protein BLNAU_15015 [Blattamonas nauphoetae]|uniref:Uncharacterized protein n=1 Tax=Blattamonas nauphoetae TaxID=2049346 RepID=A0ABQ9XC61_9EUKA|nr:hypothetical protein BLNAU_15015 [Blattamonas nauphoetae]